jgi:hypothetical protein
VLHDEDLAEHEILLDDLQRDLLEPNGFGVSKYGVVGPPRLELVDGPTIEAAALPRSHGDYLLNLDTRFWDWLAGQGGRPGDSLLLTALDVDARRYRLAHEPAAARDEEAIAARNQELIAAAVAYTRKRKGGASIWEITGHLSVSGALHRSPAPEPFSDLWTAEIWGPLVDEYDVSPFLLGGRDSETGDFLDSLLVSDMFSAEIGPAGSGEGPIISLGEHGNFQGELGVDPAALQARIDAILRDPTTPVPDDDPLLPAIIIIFAAMALPSPTGKRYQASALVELFGDDEAILDWIDHGAELGMVELDPAYAAMAEEFDPRAEIGEPAERAQPSRTLVLRVSYRYQPEFWREIEIADDQYLSDLHLAIQRALAWDNDHLYSFYMGRRPYDARTEIGGPGSDTRRRADRVTIGELELRPKQKFLYLFDFGDDHLFDIQVLRVNPKAPPGAYPRVVGQQGEHLAQHQDEEGDDGDWDDEE